MTATRTVLAAALAGSLALGLAACQGAGTSSSAPRAAAPSSLAGAPVSAAAQEAMLRYLIEEEKLAHDVYALLHDRWGARVFGNILASESTHEARVLSLLEARGLQDPRPAKAGAFTGRDLQALYDRLVAQGSASLKGAYEVGVAIERKDVADITRQLGTATEPDVVATLAALRRASENHLRAFQRQLSRS